MNISSLTTAQDLTEIIEDFEKTNISTTNKLSYHLKIKIKNKNDLCSQHATTTGGGRC